MRNAPAPHWAFATPPVAWIDMTVVGSIYEQQKHPTLVGVYRHRKLQFGGSQVTGRFFDRPTDGGWTPGPAPK